MSSPIADTIASTLTVEVTGSSQNTVRIDRQWWEHPYTVVGQVRGGTFDIEIDRHGLYRVTDGGAYVLPAGTRFRTHAADPDVLSFLWFHLQARLLTSVDLFTLVDIPFSLPPSVGRHVGRINLARTRNQQRLSGLHLFAAQKHLDFELAMHLLAHAAPRRDHHASLRSIERIEPALALMQQRLHAPLSRSDLAAAVHLSPTRFHYVFKQAMGVAPLAYLAQLRIQRAQQLLTTTRLRIADIAHAVGCSDAFHFSRQFRKHVSISPHQYRTQSARWFADQGSKSTPATTPPVSSDLPSHHV